MNDEIPKMAKVRHDLEDRISRVILAISSHRFSGFEDLISAILQQKQHRITLCSALGLPVGTTNYLLSLLTSDSPSSITMIRVIGRRTYYFLRVLHEALSSPLAPKSWPLFGNVLESNMDLCRPFLPKYESEWSIIKSELEKYGSTKADLSSHSENLFDPTQWAILYCISREPDVPMVGEDYSLITKTLGHHLVEHKFVDPANKWWAFERYFWAAQMLANIGVTQPANYDLVCNYFENLFDEKFPADSSASLFESNPEIAKTIICPEIYTQKRTLLFAATAAMRLLTNPLIIANNFSPSVKQKLNMLIDKAEKDIPPMVDHGHLWWMCQKLIFIYRLIYFRAVMEVLELLKDKEIAMQKYKINNKYVYSGMLKERIDAVSNSIKVKLEKPRAKNWEISIMILGPSGVGKSSIVESVCSALKDYVLIDSPKIHEKMLQELATPDLFHKFLKETRDQFEKLGGKKRIPVFIDEFHSRMHYNQFTSILPFLTRENHAFPIFATSECNSREEFQQHAASGQTIHKIDFSTRIQNWLELPGLEYSATQRILLYLVHNRNKRKAWNCKKQKLALVALNFGEWKTARDIQQLTTEELDAFLEKINEITDFNKYDLKNTLSLFSGEILIT